MLQILNTGEYASVLLVIKSSSCMDGERCIVLRGFVGGLSVSLCMECFIDAADQGFC